ncbi:Glycoside Hydrolase Family 38 protein [Pelomyxa schiedti]|nr:Glycoside Hydrolase Family 38 protein [Pelomyxa schiedti]
MFHHHRDITLSRVESFLTKSFLLKSRLYGATHPLHVTRLAAPRPSDPELSTFAEAASLLGSYVPCSVGDVFGPIWSTHWLHVEVEIPESFTGKEVHLLWDSGSESMLFSETGVPLQSMTGTTDDTQRNCYILSKTAQAGKKFAFFIQLACCEMFGNSPGWECGPEAPPSTRDFKLKKAEIAVFNRNVNDLANDLYILWNAAKNLPETSQGAADGLWAADDAVNMCFLDDDNSIQKAREYLHEFIASHTGHTPHMITAVGHCHIDTAWLWPYSVTKAKCARSWVAQLRNAEQFPQFCFAVSQAQQMEWVKDLYPALYEEIKMAVANKRFAPVGATWVEMDCNIPCGESLVRQFLLGQRFFKSEFGKYCDIFWLPDTFGYAAQLPQLMRGANVEYFLTQKLSWNQTNKFPYTTFFWEGLDGSRVLTHFPPADTYNARVDAQECIKCETNNKDRERCPESLLLFGHGDGGGGPQYQMLDRYNTLSQGIPGLPLMKSATPSEFFSSVLERSGHKLLSWRGELYFEMHRGTYTTQAKNKFWNRKSEFLLHDIECVCSLATALKLLPLYPYQELSHMWKLILLNQFHDVLPGSSIGMVYEDSAQHYLEVQTKGANLLKLGMDALFKQLLSTAGDAHKALAVMNTLSFPRTEVVELDEESFSQQSAYNGKFLAVVQAPSVGYTVSDAPCPVPPVIVTPRQSQYILENQYLTACISSDGTISSLMCKSSLHGQRECIATHAVGNKFVVFEDMPNYWDNWDVDIFHLEKPITIDPHCVCEVVESGPIRATLKVSTLLLPKCKITQWISLKCTSKYLEFKTQVSWNEDHKILKVEFPVNVRSLNATYETQFGHIERPTHMNTSWDMAKFEVCAHKWADLSEHGFGVALLNDCKYGHSVLNNVMRISLLRGPKMPDKTADMGDHTFSYAIMPHFGMFQEAGVIEEAAAFNSCLISLPILTNQPHTSKSFVELSEARSAPAQGVLIDTLKMAETGNGNIIMRLYECFGGSHNHLELKIDPTLSEHFSSLQNVNLLEEAQSSPVPLPAALSFQPFQIKSLSLNNT